MVPQRPPVQRGPQAADDEWFNDEVSRVMADAADTRAEHELTRSSEDERLARREAAAISGLIRSRARRATGTPARDPGTRAQGSQEMPK